MVQVTGCLFQLEESCRMPRGFRRRGPKGPVAVRVHRDEARRSGLSRRHEAGHTTTLEQQSRPRVASCKRRAAPSHLLFLFAFPCSPSFLSRLASHPLYVSEYVCLAASLHHFLFWMPRMDVFLAPLLSMHSYVSSRVLSYERGSERRE